MEVRRGKGSSVKGSRILVFPFVAYPYKVSVFPNAPIGNVLSCFCLSFFVKEDDGVEMGLSSVVPYPSLTRVVRILEVASKGGGNADRFGRGCGTGDHGLVLCEASRFIAVNAVLTHIWFGEV